METKNSAVRKTYQLLYWTFGLVPIVAGLDKFTNILADWEKYLAPWMADLMPFAPHTFMMIVGVIEIIAGILVLSKPKIGGTIVSIWLVLIALSLITSWTYVDVAVRDIVMAIAAFSMVSLAGSVQQKNVG